MVHFYYARPLKQLSSKHVLNVHEKKLFIGTWNVINAIFVLMKSFQSIDKALHGRRISIKISRKIVPTGSLDNKPALV